jgi:hypothetical protein
MFSLSPLFFSPPPTSLKKEEEEEEEETKAEEKRRGRDLCGKVRRAPPRSNLTDFLHRT